MIFNIQRFSLHDGEGLRTTIFFKGCPLRCPWCSNPESQYPYSQLMHDRNKCINCRDCLLIHADDSPMKLKENRPCLHRSQHSGSEDFRDICPALALTVAGKSLTAEEIVHEVLKDRAFYTHSGGGVTLSGGEPLMQPGLCRTVAEKLQQEGIETALETCLHVPRKNLESVIPSIDEFLCDIKHIDSDIFRQHTGGNLDLIQSNLNYLAEKEIPVRARIPVIYGFNHDEKTMKSILNYLETLGNITAVDFMPYHPLGAGKYENLGQSYHLPLHMMSEEEVTPYRAEAEKRNLPVTIGG